MSVGNPVFAAIDIGTNSIRLAVVREEENQRLTMLTQQREVVRLGEGEFATNLMTPDAIARGALVCARFADMARGFGAEEIVAFATAAVREADNRDEFVERVRREAQVEVHVISGVEEARLIWLGVSSGIDLGERTAMLIDIGGGSTEVIVGKSGGHEILESLKLGAIRLSNRFFNTDGPIPAEQFERVLRYVVGIAAPVTRRIAKRGFDLAVGSAGTITTLADIVARKLGDAPVGSTRNYVFRLPDLIEVNQMLCKLPLKERLRVPGMDASRADIILGGAAIVQTLMQECGAQELMLSERGLRDGILLDHVLRESAAREQFQALSVRKRSILELAATCNYEPQHAQEVTRLALRLFDELARLRQHQFGAAARELLEYASITHDIGAFISQSNHQKHAYYIVRNADLLGFDETELDIIGNVARYHRKGIPRRRNANLRELTRAEIRLVRVLAAILRVAEGLDRSHLSLVRDIRLTMSARPRRFLLTILSDADCELETWGVMNSRDLFEYAFEGALTVEVAHAIRPAAGV